MKGWLPSLTEELHAHVQDTQRGFAHWAACQVTRLEVVRKKSDARHFQRTPWGVEKKKRGEENLTKDTPRKRSFGPPFVWYVCHPTQVSLQYFSCKRSTTEQTRSSFGGVQTLSGECVLWCVFLPHTFCSPPYHGLIFQSMADCKLELQVQGGIWYAIQVAAICWKRR